MHRYGKLSPGKLEKLMPHSGDDVNVYKRWINRVYEDKAFYTKKPKKVSLPQTPKSCSRSITSIYIYNIYSWDQKLFFRLHPLSCP